MSKGSGNGEVRILPLAVEGEIRPGDLLSAKLLAAAMQPPATAAAAERS